MIKNIPIYGCRMLLYAGPESMTHANLIVHSSHALVNQVYSDDPVLPLLDQGLYHDDALSLIRNHRRNLNGWGIAWYDDQTGNVIRRRGDKMADLDPEFHMSYWEQSKIFFSHVRAGPIESEINAHPFIYDNDIIWMHNGDIRRDPLDAIITDEIKSLVNGSTDSEIAGAIFSKYFSSKRKREMKSGVLFLKAMLLTIRDIHEACAASSLNFIVSDGSHIIATRFRTDPTEDPPSLYFRTGCHWNQAQEDFADSVTCLRKSIIIASEPISRSKSRNWNLLLKDQLLFYDLETTKTHLFCLTEACVNDAKHRNVDSDLISIENMSTMFANNTGIDYCTE